MKIKVVYKKVGQKPEVREIDRDDLAAMQSMVGGYIEVVRFIDGDMLLVCNEDGVYNQKPNLLFEGNRALVNGQIYGDIFITGAKGEDFRSLTQQEIERATALLEEYAISYRQRT